MEKADIFRKGWKFTVETSLIKETKNYWFYDIKCAYLIYWKNTPEIIGYERLQDEWKVSWRWRCMIKKTSDREEDDWEQIYNHFAKRFKWHEIRFIRF